MNKTSAPRATPLKMQRVYLNLSIHQVAKGTGISPAGIHKIEKGLTTPRREHARSLWEFYKGAVPLVKIYDPFFEEDINAKDQDKAG